ncbi:hypothetical protein BDV93DRAFT_547791, partial [Ceratobasidium sp. AG-I]
MDVVPTPRVIMVCFLLAWEFHYSVRTFRDSGCLVYECIISEVYPPSFLDRVLRRKDPSAQKVQAAYDFIEKNYQSGDSVMIFDAICNSRGRDDAISQRGRHNAIRQLAKALDTGSLHKSRTGSAGKRIPIKCMYLDFFNQDLLGWPGVNQLLSDLPFKVDNVLCVGEHDDFGYGYG